MSDEVALPPLPSPSAGPDELREALRSLILWAQAREPLADGESLDKFTTNRALVGIDLLAYSTGSGGSAYLPGPGTGGGTYVPPDYESDYTPPTPISGLAVSAGIDFFLVEFDAPTYTQGGGNAYTDIYAANYAGTGPLPTFGSAVPVYRCMGALNIAAIPAQPGQTTHFWAGAVTRSNPATRQVDGSGPTGGTNGVSATTGVDVTSMLDVLTAAAEGGGPYSKISFRADLFYIGNSAGTYSEIPFYVATTSFTQGGLTVGPGVYMRNAFIADGTISNAMIGNLVVTNAKIADMSVAKLTAGSIAVGEYIQSTGFVTTVSGFKIDGAGNAEFNGIVARGNIYAPAALIQGLLTAAQINAEGLTIKNTAGDILLYAGAGATPPWVVNIASVGGEIELTEPSTDTNTAELRSIKAGDGMNISVDAGVLTFTSKSSDDSAIRLAADVTRSSTTPADVTGMLLTLEASASYRIEGTLMYRSAAATTGLVFAATLPSSAQATIRVHANVTQTTTESHVLHIPTGGATGSVAFSATWAADPTAPTAFDAAFDTICSVEGIITTGADVGSFQLGFASEVAASTVTLRAGSVLLVERVRMETITGTFSLAGSPGFAATYTAESIRTNAKPSSAGLKITLDEAGAWTVTRFGLVVTGSGTPTSGSWSSPTGSGAGSQWQVMFETTATTTGDAYISNEASSYQSLTSPRNYSAVVYADSGAPGMVDVVTVAIKLRNAASGAVTTLATVDLDLEASTT
ncbi:MAG: hypothetical protein QG602_1218 [Verrucomicrobiota bacterium]|nr:hypothetical protein [Verrucomicrobiota bacterium]